eukprot:Nitzschia sp. Nitz4//scaffold254_size28068//15513//18353//NITZ4_008153-RA/size28068-processed-gene-0.3-mRNA-1//1//CDS//3329544337//4924//frame0
MPAPAALLTQSRKERRKQERLQKKRKHSHPHPHHSPSTNTLVVPSQSAVEPTSKKNKTNPSKKTKTQEQSSSNPSSSNNKSSSVDPSLLAAIHQDDLEIAALEAKLFKNKKSKQTLHKEYAKLEGYGDDFGDFLDDLDDLERRVQKAVATTGKAGGSSKDVPYDDDDDDDDDSVQEDVSDEMDSDLEAALDRDDQEIAQLEKKLGIHKPKEKSKLHKEYQQEGYGDDFGDFLDDLDDMMARVKDPKHRVTKRVLESDDEEEPMSDEDDEDEEELVPMKGALEDELEDLEEDDSVMEDLEAQEMLDADQSSEEPEPEEIDDEEEEDQPNDPQEESEEESVPESEDESPPEPDHDISDTYRPQSGQDIYGNRVDGADDSGSKRTKYVPPHLRNQANAEGDETKMREIKRGLNNALNRLSEDTLISVAQQVAQLYSSHPTQLVHDMLWKNTKDACVQTPVLMKGLIPVYIACVCGVHIQTGDTVQVGEFLLEVVLTELWKALAEYRERILSKDDGNDRDVPLEVAGKHICNQMLILCYLYNYNVVHCTFMYDIIRHFIDKFSEIDVECLLLLLSHCGRSLRSDDPLALKEIVLLVQRKNAEASKGSTSSRAEYMVSAIMDLKNNKRGRQDDVYNEKTAKLRKALGRIKSTAAKTNTAKTVSEASLRISLEDILQADTKGRWWKVGASWVGNQYRFSDGKDEDDEDPTSTNKAKDDTTDENEALLQLATKLRMNSDRKRSIFCIIMGSEDCEDAFEKLCRGGMLQNKSERDVCRVLLECCCHEPSYNQFYGYLAARMCEFQPQCKFSLQLAFWDLFKQMEDMGARKAVNVAKFLFDLVVVHQLLRMMTVIKVIDLSEGNDLDETTLIFLTVLLSNVLDHYSTTEPIKDMFGGRNNNGNNHEKDEGVRGGLLLFFMETLKNSPKNTKGSQFHKNFKAAVKVLDTDGFEDMF